MQSAITPVKVNLGNVVIVSKAPVGKPIQLASCTFDKSTSPIKYATAYPIATEIKIGTNLKNDFFKILINIIVITTINAIIKLSLSKVLLL